MDFAESILYLKKTHKYIPHIYSEERLEWNTSSKFLSLDKKSTCYLIFSIFPFFYIEHVSFLNLKKCTFLKCTSLLCSQNILYFDASPWHTLLCVPLGQCVCGSLGTEEVMFASWPAPNTALPRQKMLWWGADHRGGGVQMLEWSHQQPSLVYKQVKSTTEKLLLSTGLLRNLCFLYTPCWLLEFYLSCFLALNLFDFVKEKKKEGNQPDSFWFSLRIHPNFPSRHMSLTGPSNHQGGPRASKSHQLKATSSSGLCTLS